MARRDDDLGHEPSKTDDEFFAPVTRDSDGHGGTRPERRDVPHVSGTGVPGVDRPDRYSGTADEAGVRAAEQHDATRRHRPHRDGPASQRKGNAHG